MPARQAHLPLLLGLALACGAAPARTEAGAPSAPPAAPRAAAMISGQPGVAPASGWLKSELYFGARLAHGSLISPEAWEAFLAEVITPAFPDGLTVLEASGQMKDSSGTIRRQPTWVVVVLRPVSSLHDQRIRAVIGSFRSRFRGAELMRVDIPAAQPQFFAN